MYIKVIQIQKYETVKYNTSKNNMKQREKRRVGDIFVFAVVVFLNI